MTRLRRAETGRKERVVNETIEDLKAIGAALAERARDLPRARWVRRLRRRPARVALAAGGGMVTLFIVVNAGWQQAERHPAPMLAESSALFETNVRRVRELAPADDIALPSAEESAEVGRLAAESSELLADIQQRLAALGYFEGSAHGLDDAATREAIVAFQRRAGLPETGEPGLELLASLAAASPAAATRRPAAGAAAGEQSADAAAGAEGTDVRTIQAALTRLGYGPVTVDGIFGAETAGAIRRFESRNGMRETGRITPDLIEALVREQSRNT